MISSTPGKQPDDTLKQKKHDIFYGADVNDIGEIEAALAEDPSVLNAREPNTGKTALTIAAADGNLLAVWYLLDQLGADPWIADKHGRLALDYARAIGHPEVRSMLLEAMYPDLDLPPSQADSPPIRFPGPRR